MKTKQNLQYHLSLAANHLTSCINTTSNRPISHQPSVITAAKPCCHSLYQTMSQTFTIHEDSVEAERQQESETNIQNSATQEAITSAQSVAQQSTSGQEPARHRCPQCSSSFIRRHNLQSHMLTHGPVRRSRGL